VSLNDGVNDSKNENIFPKFALLRTGREDGNPHN